MLVYTISLGTPGNLTTNGTANTETDAFTLQSGTRNAYLLSVQLMGKGSSLTSISGIVMRFVKWGTASTGGTSQNPRGADPGNQLATASVVTRATAGSTRTNHHISGCGAAGPGGFVSECTEAAMVMQGNSSALSTGSIDGLDASGTVSLNYELSFKFAE